MRDETPSRKPSEKTRKVSGNHALGRVSYDAANGLLLRDGKEIALRAKSLAVLDALLSRRGAVVSKEALLDAAWPETHVTEDSLAKCIADIRRALGPDAAILETRPKRGYRLKAPDTAPTPVRLGAVVLPIAVLLAGAIWAGLAIGTEPAPFGGRIGVLVLPFEDYGTGADAGYLGDALSEGVIADLSRFGEVAVIAANSGAAVEAETDDVAEMADATGARYVLLGSQRKQDEALRVNVRLVDARDGVTIWAETYDRDVGELFAVQSDLVRSVSARVGHQLAYAEEPPGDRGRVSALHYHIRGRNALQNGFDAATNAAFARWNERAIEADPEASWGWSGLGWYYRNAAQFGWNGLDRDDALAHAVINAERGLELGPDDYYAHFVRAGIHATAGEIEAAIRVYDRAIALNPSASNALVLSTTPLLYQGRVEEAINRIERATAIDPFHPPWFHWQLAWAQWQNGDCAAAEESFGRMPSIPPAAQVTHAVVLECLGRIAEGRAALTAYVAQRPDFSLAGERARLENWATPGELDRWLAALAELGAPA